MTRVTIPIAFLLISGLLLGCVTRSNHAIRVDGERRTYELHVSAKYDGSEPVPLLLALHPFSGTGISMAKMTGFNAIADRENFIAAYPDGELRRWRAVNETPEDVRFLSALLDSLEATYNIDPGRVYITGASNGSHMAYRMLCESGSRFAAAATVMGAQTLDRFSIACRDAPPVPLLMIQGTADDILPWDGRTWPKATPLLSMDKTLQIWIARNHCRPDGTVTRIANAAADDETAATRMTFVPQPGGKPVVLITVANGGHTWPGGYDNYPQFIVGNTSRDFEASRIIWDFFKEHRQEVPHVP